MHHYVSNDRPLTTAKPMAVSTSPMAIIPIPSPVEGTRWRVLTGVISPRFIAIRSINQSLDLTDDEKCILAAVTFDVLAH